MKMKYIRDFFIAQKTAISAIFIVTAFYLTLFALGITCPIKYLTGVSCMGCGMTRAWLHVFMGDFANAFDYHPLFWTLIPAAAAFICRKKHPLLFKIVIGAAILMFVIVYLSRMFDSDCSVVVFEPHNGVIYELVSRLMSLWGNGL